MINRQRCTIGKASAGPEHFHGFWKPHPSLIPRFWGTFGQPQWCTSHCWKHTNKPKKKIALRFQFLGKGTSWASLGVNYWGFSILHLFFTLRKFFIHFAFPEAGLPTVFFKLIMIYGLRRASNTCSPLKQRWREVPSLAEQKEYFGRSDLPKKDIIFPK